ncbi:UNVERIFIED_CONTAM: hypothetical protein FKN15_068765 [Acipenser sinensis]
MDRKGLKAFNQHKQLSGPCSSSRPGRFRIFSHPNVLPMLGACQSPPAPHPIIITHWMPYGSLYNVLHEGTNLAAINALVLYKECTGNTVTRRDFILQLALELLQEHFDKRHESRLVNAPQPSASAAATGSWNKRSCQIGRGQQPIDIRLSVMAVTRRGSAHRYHPCADSGAAKTNTRCPPKCVPSADRFFLLCRPAMQPTQSYSVGGQGSSGQLIGARPVDRGADFVVDQTQAVKFGLDIARGMAFLHTLEPLIPRHYLNSKSIMIDEDMTARISMADVKFSFQCPGRMYSPAWIAPED